MKEAQASRPDRVAHEDRRDNGISSYNLLSLKEKPLFSGKVESASTKALLPNLSIEELSDLTKRIARRDVYGGSAERELNDREQRVAKNIEKSILSGDLETLKSTMNQFAGRGHELLPIMAKVQKDMRDHGIRVNFKSGCVRGGPNEERHIECQVEISKNSTLEFLALSTDPREQPAGSNVIVYDHYGRIRAKPGAVCLHPGMLLKRIAS